MGILPKKTNEFDLTDDEVTFLRGSSVPAEVRTYLARQHENIGTKTSAYRKVAAAANAEADSLLAVKRLAAVQGEMVEVAELRQALTSTQQQIEGAKARESQARAELQRVKAIPAQVVHSGGQ